jgi:hypothetical protein
MNNILNSILSSLRSILSTLMGISAFVVAILLSLPQEPTPTASGCPQVACAPVYVVVMLYVIALVLLFFTRDSPEVDRALSRFAQLAQAWRKSESGPPVDGPQP